MTADAINNFVAEVRRRRQESGRPNHIADAAVYGLLDGLLARHVDDLVGGFDDAA